MYVKELLIFFYEFIKRVVPTDGGGGFKHQNLLLGSNDLGMGMVVYMPRKIQAVARHHS